ncbi:MAG: hypothetical protein INR68_00250 [Methylobacterium mesophilicum]|nr:hypothetical protein [Methylobacterium mesophilicum]
MPEKDEGEDYAYDDRGEIVPIRTGQPPEGIFPPRGPIRPVTLDEMPAIHARNRARDAAERDAWMEREAEAERERQAARLEERRRFDAEHGVVKISSVLDTPPRKLNLDTSDNEG